MPRIRCILGLWDEDPILELPNYRERNATIPDLSLVSKVSFISRFTLGIPVELLWPRKWYSSCPQVQVSLCSKYLPVVKNRYKSFPVSLLHLKWTLSRTPRQPFTMFFPLEKGTNSHVWVLIRKLFPFVMAHPHYHLPQTSPYVTGSGVYASWVGRAMFAYPQQEDSFFVASHIS